ncbi:hypothetical protein MMC22_006964 [Lobaria immixta]|nr:hypothetical protein [Lobaria immixta]
MNETPNEVQASNGVQLPLEIMLLPDPGVRTPLGEIIDENSAALLVAIPIAWHMRYWLNLNTVAILRGEDAMLMSLRIDMEQHNILDHELKSQVLAEWIPHRIAHQEECLRSWRQKTLETEEAQPYLRDINRMLVGKERKTRYYLRRMEILMVTSLRVANIETSRGFFEKLSQLYDKLQKEARADAEARNQAPSGTHGVHNHAAQALEVIEAGLTTYD